MSSGALFDSLMAGSADEPSTAYGLIAESVELPDDRMSVTFTLREQARFHDGSPITAQDVVWTYQTLITKGHPAYRVTLADVDDGRGRWTSGACAFRFKNNTNRTLPLTVAGLPVLPSTVVGGQGVRPADARAAARQRRLPDGGDPARARDHLGAGQGLLGAGPADRARHLQLRPRPGRLLSRHTVMREAFKAGLIDVREENTAADWFNAYDFPAVKQGLVIKREVQARRAAGHAALRLQHAPAAVPGHPGASRRSATR